MKEFPPRIMALIKRAWEKGWEDSEGMTYVDDAAAAITWIESAQAELTQMILPDADQRDLNIGRAIQRASMELPATCLISIDVGMGVGSVVWIDEDGDDCDEGIEYSHPLATQIHAAIDAAIASVSHK